MLNLLGPLTIPELIGREPSDERSLSLGAAPAYLTAEQDGAEVRYSVVIAEALGRRGLMDLLYTLAPYKAHGPDRFARLLDNWAIIDRARTNSASESLFLQHAKSLRTSWWEFTRHRELFAAVLSDETENTRVLPVLTWTKHPDEARAWRFDQPDAGTLDLIEELAARTGTAPAPDALLGLVTIPYYLPELRRSWPAWRPLVKDGKSNYIGPASVPVMALIHRRALLRSALVRNVEERLTSVGARRD